MPRRSRSWVPNAGAHTISRFVDRRFYIVDDADRGALLDAIGRANHRWDWQWLSFAAMSSHIHYGHIAGQVDPDRFFRSAHTRFALQYHRRHSGQTLGPLFADRPTIHPVRPAGLRRLVAYHHRNPVEAGVVVRARESNWTSHRAYLRLEAAPPWLDIERALDVLGFQDTAAGRSQFDDFVMSFRLDDWRSETQSEPPLAPSRRGATDDVDWPRLIQLARKVTGLPRHEALTSRRRPAVKTRLLIASVATVDLAQTYAAVATTVGMSTGSVFNLIARKRPDGDFDESLAHLRRLLAAK